MTIVDEERTEVTAEQMDLLIRYLLEDEGTKFLRDHGFDRNGNPLTDPELA